MALSVKTLLDVLVRGWADDGVWRLSGATDAARVALWAPDGSVLYAVSAKETVLPRDQRGGVEPIRFEKPGED